MNIAVNDIVPDIIPLGRSGRPHLEVTLEPNDPNSPKKGKTYTKWEENLPNPKPGSENSLPVTEHCSRTHPTLRLNESNTENAEDEYCFKPGSLFKKTQKKVKKTNINKTEKKKNPQTDAKKQNSQNKVKNKTMKTTKDLKTTNNLVINQNHTEEKQIDPQCIEIHQLNMNHSYAPSADMSQKLDNEWTQTRKHILCIQEPYKDYKTGHIKNTPKNYTNIFSEREPHKRAIIQIPKNLEKHIMFHTELSDRDNCVISIPNHENEKQRIYIASTYLPLDEKVSDSFITKTIKETETLKSGLIICADTNAHSTQWGNQSNNERGNELELILGNNNMSIENTDLSPTYQKHKNKSTIDLTITNNYAPRVNEWCIDKGESLSDHKLIKFTIKSKEEKRKKSLAKDKIKIPRKANILMYQNEVKKRAKNIPLLNSDTKRPNATEIDNRTEQITNILLDSWGKKVKKQRLH